MIVRHPTLQRLVAVLLIAFVAISAQAWAGHIDWPAAQGSDHAHIETTAFDVHPATGAGDADHASHSDHCCHASAHLVGLRSDLAGVDFAAATPARGGVGKRYVSLTHAPLIDPPIA